MTLTLEQILENPEMIKSIPDNELAVMLSAYFPAVRKAALPEAKSSKKTNTELMMENVLKDNADLIKKMLAERKKI